MKKKMIIGSIVAVLVMLMMASSATAVTIPQSNEDPNSGNEVTNYVEPNIHISVMQKRILKAALKYVDDSDFHTLLQKIIEKKGPVNSNDIEHIINYNDLEVGTITSGGIATGDADGSSISGGSAFCIRRPLCFIVLPLMPVAALHFNVFYQAHVFPNYPNRPAQITINGKFINYDIVGNAVGFLGFVCNNMAPDVGFDCQGIALLINYR